MKKRIFVIAAISSLSLLAWSAPKRTLKVSASPGAAEEGKRHKVLEFDGHRVEALGRRPLDSFSQINEKERNARKKHLYEKRKDFHPETSETLNEMRYGL